MWCEFRDLFPRLEVLSLDPVRLAIADEWSVRGDYVARVHHMPRVALLVPTEAVDPPHVPLDRIDVMRVTTTDSDNVDELSIEDVWGGKLS